MYFELFSLFRELMTAVSYSADLHSEVLRFLVLFLMDWDLVDCPALCRKEFSDLFVYGIL